MREMKDSGVAWIGEVPADWEMPPNYVVLGLSKKIVGVNSDSYPLLSLTKRGVVKRNIEDGGKFPSSFDSYQIVEPGQIVFCLFDIDETPRTVGLSSIGGIITGAYDVFNIDAEVCDPRFVLYYYIAVDDGKHLRLHYKSMRKTVTPTAFAHVKMLKPPLSEQHKIVAFLDERCAAIDADIASRREIIEKLGEYKKSVITKAVTKGLDPSVEMRDSGVEWIGKVPAEWLPMKAKRCINVRSNGNWGDEENMQAVNLPCMRAADFDYERLSIKPAGSFATRSYAVGKVDRFLLHHGDILVEKSGGGEKVPVGRAVLFNEDYAACYSNFLERIMVKRSAVLPAFFLYWWTANYQNGWFRPFFNQTTGIQNLDTSELLSSSTIFLPSLAEQERVIAFLDVRCAKIDEAVSRQEQLIDKLEEYRKTLLYHAVTGKIDFSKGANNA